MTGRFPHPEFPAGWFAVAWAEEVGTKRPLPVRAFGEELAVFRGEGGRIHVLDAICPHLGAHMGHGSRVVDGELECPFHGWRFGATGRCTVAHGAQRLPVAALRCRPAMELHDRIWVWNSAPGEAPSWPLPASFEGGPWVRVGRIDRTFPSHPQDVMENGVDSAHFRFVHGMSEVRDPRTVYEGHRLRTTMGVSSGSARLGLPGLRIHGFNVISLWGLGLHTSHVTMRLPGLGEVEALVVEGVVPRGEGQVSLLVDIHLPRSRVPGVAGLAGRVFTRAVARDLDADIAVWTHRRHLNHPMLTAADPEIGPYRRWARQFYPSL